MNTHDTVGKLERPDGTEAQTPEEKVAELNTFFGSVFVQEDCLLVQKLNRRKYSTLLPSLPVFGPHVF